MSGEDWDEFSHTNKKQPAAATGGVNEDDDFGDFEGFDADEVDAEMAQPLPEALQASWASFPDYVPSQHTTSSALQPDLLPTQASVNDQQPTISVSHASVASLDLPGLNSIGASLGGPQTLSNVGQSSQRLPRHELPIVPLNLPDVSPLEPNVVAGSFGITPDLQQDSNNNHQHVVLGVSLSQPDLAGLDLHRSSSSPLQSQFPDVNPHSGGGGYGIRDLPDLSPDIGEGVSRFGQLPSPNSRPDVSNPDVAGGSSSQHSPNLNILPDISPSIRNNRNQHFDLPDIRSNASGFSQSQPDLADLQLPARTTSQKQDFAAATASSHLLSQSTTASAPLATDHAPQASSPLNEEHGRSSFSRGLNSCHTTGSGDSLTQVHEQLNMLRHENERIMRELNEVKSRNVELVRLLSECLLAVRNWELQPQGDQLQRVHQEIQVLTKAVGELQVCVPVQTEQLKSELSHQVEESLSRQSEQLTQYLEDHKESSTDVMAALGQHESQIVNRVQSAIDLQSVETKSQLQAFKQELMCDVKKVVQDALAEGANCHGNSDGVSVIERAVQDFKLYTEEQKKKDEKSRTVLVSLIDSLLANTRQQLHDLYPSANSPNS